MTQRTVNVTPDWRGSMPILITLLRDGDPKGKKFAEDELMRLAACVDQLNAGKEHEQ